ncbi:hypothetical protein JZO70_04735 [Enterococcus sp. 669A]|uniref:Uncharacterized protein n=1 Tax=Candidatus Enterococcus moelleringii TaxID=2815325 RepID=A0ABS3L769_9ENTE|nr:hypothetical protein [Enterococcus sp. 669A]MBO1305453.1 hypothetical protein [Enterococcus sp. 669A]
MPNEVDIPMPVVLPPTEPVNETMVITDSTNEQDTISHRKQSGFELVQSSDEVIVLVDALPETRIPSEELIIKTKKR